MITTKTLPADVQEVFEITEPIQGGPRLALPHYGQSGDVDFSTISLAQAEALEQAEFPYLRRRQKVAPAKDKHKAEVPL